MLKNRLLVAVMVLAAMAAAALIGLRQAARSLEAGLRDALGPRATIGSVALGWTGVEVRDLRIRGASAGWTADDELRAQRVRVQPSLASVWSRGWRVRRIEIDGAFVAILRTRAGKLRIAPALLERGGAEDSSPATQVHIDTIVLRDTTIDFVDASVRGAPHRIRLDELKAELGPLALPALDTAMQIDLQARLRGPQRDGTLKIAGELTPSTRHAELKAEARGVDLVALQPYLVKVNEAGVRRGTLDLTLDASVKAQHLHAPGRLTLTGLELNSGGLLSTFAGVPRHAVLTAMQRDGRIDVGFTLDGRLDDPSFSLNENLATKLAGGLAETLGVSLGGVVGGVGSVIKGLFGR
jgi:hypothetical protein